MKLHDSYDSESLLKFLKGFNYSVWSGMTPLEADEEEVRKKKGLKILAPNKLLTD